MKNKVLTGIIVILLIAIGVLAWVNGRSVAGLEPATLVIKEAGVEIGSISLEEMTALEGIEEFTMVLRSSGKDPVENRYTGIALSKVLAAVQADLLSQDALVSIKAIDGFAVAYSGEEVLQPEHVYVVWLKDGKPLGNKANGGKGPLLIIPRQDEFGQRWCKFAVEVDIR